MNQAGVMHSGPSLSPRAPLGEDTRGAVMVTGLFMAFFLVGALWFVIGVGDAVIFRDRMQEAADHGAFTSAALQAKGMNFISAVNLIMLLMVVVHVVLGIIHDVMLAACVLTGVGCVLYAPALHHYHSYAGIMKPILTGLAKAEKIAALGYPYIGTFKGLDTAAKYGNQGRIGHVSALVVGPSNVPGLVGTGLPVSPRPMGYLCEKAAGVVVDYAKNIAASMVPQWLAFLFDPLGSLVDQVVRPKNPKGGLGVPLAGNLWEMIWNYVQGIVSAGVHVRYCNDLGMGALDPIRQRVSQAQTDAKARVDRENKERADRNRAKGSSPETMINGWSSSPDPGFDRGWGEDGPMLVNERNGSDGYQVWAINDAKLRETNEKKVTLAKGPTASRGGLDGHTFDEEGTYYAQAEFYFDCANRWDADECNGGMRDFNASFAIKWRARLRRVELPNLGAMLMRFGGRRLTHELGEIVGDRLNGLVNGPLKAVRMQALRSRVHALLYSARDKLANQVQGPSMDGIYH